MSGGENDHVTNQLMSAVLIDVAAVHHPRVRGHAVAMETAALYHISRQESSDQD